MHRIFRNIWIISEKVLKGTCYAMDVSSVKICHKLMCHIDIINEETIVTKKYAVSRIPYLCPHYHCLHTTVYITLSIKYDNSFPWLTLMKYQAPKRPWNSLWHDAKPTCGFYVVHSSTCHRRYQNSIYFETYMWIKSVGLVRNCIF